MSTRVQFLVLIIFFSKSDVYALCGGDCTITVASPLTNSIYRAGLVPVIFHSTGLDCNTTSMWVSVEVDDADVLPRDPRGFMLGDNLSVPLDVGMHEVTVYINCASPHGDVIISKDSTYFKTVLHTKTGRETDGVYAPPDSVKYTLAVVSVFRDEDLYLQEWVEFHLCAGVQHFYLYDHRSQDPDAARRALEPYIRAGLVTLDAALESEVDQRGRVLHHAQLRTFMAAVRSYGAEAEWMAFIDLDEFLYADGPIVMVQPDGSTVAEYEPRLPQVLEGFREFGGVVVHWVLYGGAGHRALPQGLVIDNYPLRQAETSTPSRRPTPSSPPTPR
mmetsp:Transcript_13275/g.36676  ORF Transcript_13275/g.36676 Transcript_13275/m.36676 type:complete len:331 (+) Transcript_13275:63-1055(+)